MPRPGAEGRTVLWQHPFWCTKTKYTHTQSCWCQVKFAGPQLVHKGKGSTAYILNYALLRCILSHVCRVGWRTLVKPILAYYASIGLMSTFPLDYLKMIAGQQASLISRLVAGVSTLVRKTNTVASKWKKVEKLKMLWAETKLRIRKNKMLKASSSDITTVNC